MEVRIAVYLQIIVTADTGIGHDGRSAAGFISCGPVATVEAVRICAVEGMVRSELVTDFVCDIIDVVSVADGGQAAGDATGLRSIAAD